MVVLRNLIKKRVGLKTYLVIIFIILFCTTYVIFKERVLDIIFQTSSIGPLFLDEASSIVPLPVHYVDTDSINEVYYYSSSSELTLTTYFTTENSMGEDIRVARLSTFNLWAGPLPDEITGKEVPITWTPKGIGQVCNILPRAGKDRIPGEPYQSCLYWFDDSQHLQYKLYTIWPEDKAVEFVNSLVEVEKGAGE